MLSGSDSSTGAVGMRGGLLGEVGKETQSGVFGHIIGSPLLVLCGNCAAFLKGKSTQTEAAALEDFMPSHVLLTVPGNDVTAGVQKLFTRNMLRIPLVRTRSNSQLLGASRGAPPEVPPRERRVPPAGAVAEVIREKGPTRVQSGRRRPPYSVPSNGPPSALATDTAPRSKRKKESPRTTDAVRHRGRGPPPQKKR
ncbi:unnamed protein product [Pleuronectes platessa]|uniref:Uncharacterized protein n=1 Tax=Pleuronectes platessa TaxID=8262 RepID=A0A9N7Y9N6_PLEPL|nr:unnamed protein product [Pleuronectes platessa]